MREEGEVIVINTAIIIHIIVVLIPHLQNAMMFTQFRS